MHRHSWVVVERIGAVVTEQCSVCYRTRTRVRGPENASPARPVVGCPDDPMRRPGALTAPPSRISGGTRQHGNEGL
jgi:hypothetical protein